MIETIQLAPGVTLRCVRDTRFKHGVLTFQMIRTMRREEAALNALIPTVLLRGTRSHPDLQSITNRLDELYGASVGALVRRSGDYQTTGLACSFMDDRFCMPGDRVLEPMIGFLRELLLEPIVEDGGFCPDFVESEKKNLIAVLDSELNDKAVYARNQALRTMCSRDSYGIPRLGDKATAAAIDSPGAYAHYRRILRESPIHIFYVGAAPAERVAEILQTFFADMDRSCIPVPASTPFRDGGGEDRREQMDVAQARLCMGYTTPTVTGGPDFPAMQMLNFIFGGGVTSKLFLNVREKQSLCYSIDSAYLGAKGILLVSAGIDTDKEQQTREEIARQLDFCREGQITDEEMTAARAAICSSLRGTHDSPGSIESYYATAALSGLGMTPQEYMQAVDRVTKDQVAAAARSLQLHSTYFLEGVAK